MASRIVEKLKRVLCARIRGACFDMLACPVTESIFVFFPGTGGRALATRARCVPREGQAERRREKEKRSAEWGCHSPSEPRRACVRVRVPRLPRRSHRTMYVRVTGVYISLAQRREV